MVKEEIVYRTDGQTDRGGQRQRDNISVLFLIKCMDSHYFVFNQMLQLTMNGMKNITEKNITPKQTNKSKF